MFQYVVILVRFSSALQMIDACCAVSKEYNAEEDSMFLRMLQSVAVPVLGNACHVFMNGLNRFQVWRIYFSPVTLLSISRSARTNLGCLTCHVTGLWCRKIARGIVT